MKTTNVQYKMWTLPVYVDPSCLFQREPSLYFHHLHTLKYETGQTSGITATCNNTREQVCLYWFILVLLWQDLETAPGTSRYWATTIKSC